MTPAVSGTLQVVRINGRACGQHHTNEIPITQLPYPQLLDAVDQGAPLVTE